MADFGLKTSEEPLLDVEGASDASMSLSQHTLTVSASGIISWQPAAGGTCRPAAGSCQLVDLLSCHSLDAPPRLVLTAYPRKSATATTRKRDETKLPCASMEQAEEAVAAIRRALPALAEKRVLVLINPFGGGGKAQGVWRKLEPLLAHTGLAFDTRVTTHAGHARAMMADLAVRRAPPKLGEYRPIRERSPL